VCVRVDGLAENCRTTICVGFGLFFNLLSLFGVAFMPHHYLVCLLFLLRAVQFVGIICVGQIGGVPSRKWKTDN